MTPKEKAKELFDKYYIMFFNTDSELGSEILVSILSKDCSLIAVNEILNNMMFYEEKFDAVSPIHHRYYWEKVKSEIEKL